MMATGTGCRLFIFGKIFAQRHYLWGIGIGRADLCRRAGSEAILMVSLAPEAGA